MGRLGAAIDSAYNKPGPRCTVVDLLPKMDPEDAEDLVQYLRRKNIYATTICNQLNALGYKDITVESLRHHRKTMFGESGGCSCRPGEAGVPDVETK